ncbi:acyltransferase family protein [Candidatus Harpocratesius sp.]
MDASFKKITEIENQFENQAENHRENIQINQSINQLRNQSATQSINRSLSSDLHLEDQNDNQGKSMHFFQIDMLKAIMLALVIMDHSFTHQFLHQYYSSFWERISIPILMIIMGFNMGYSFHQRSVNSLKELYSFKYFEAKLRRYMIPYLLLYLIHVILRLITNLAHIPVNGVFFYDQSAFRYLGFTFFYGPGLWFIPVIFGSILIFPILYYCYTKLPVLTLICTFIIELLTHIISAMIIILNDKTFDVRMIFFFYNVCSMLSAIGIGLWFSTNYRWNALRNLYIWILFPIGLTYMIFNYLDILLIPFLFGDYHLFYFMYSAGLFLIAMRLIPKNPKGKVADFFRLISKATYHILLAQIFYFSIIYQFFLQMYDGISSTPDIFDGNPINYLWYYPLNVIITFTLGITWYLAEKRFHQNRKQNVTYAMIYRILLILAFFAYGAWFVCRILFLFI